MKYEVYLDERGGKIVNERPLSLESARRLASELAMLGESPVIGNASKEREFPSNNPIGAFNAHIRYSTQREIVEGEI